MGRPKLIENEGILEAAREAFLEVGVGATTGEIARRAGVSEATIFKRFSTKAELFFSAMGFPAFDARQEIEALRETGGVREGIESISLRFLEYLSEVIPILTRLLAHPGFSAAELAERYPEMPAHALVEAFAEYIDSERQAARVGNCDPHAVAFAFFGVLHNDALLEHIGLLPKDDASRKKRTRSFVDVVWHGIKPAGPHSGAENT